MAAAWRSTLVNLWERETSAFEQLRDGSRSRCTCAHEALRRFRALPQNLVKESVSKTQVSVFHVVAKMRIFPMHMWTRGNVEQLKSEEGFERGGTDTGYGSEWYCAMR